MKERVIRLVGPSGKALFCDTFHAFCAEVIREFAESLGYDRDFSIYSQSEADELMDDVLRDMRYKISSKKLTEVRAGNFFGMTSIERKQAEQAVSEYRNRLIRINAFDFDSLIGTVRNALSDISISTELKARYTYVFVDEFQDTDPEQWAIIKSLQPDNLFIVGDDNQSIYGFRGADVDIILSLAQAPEYRVVKLERHYRSTLPIVTAANNLISHNHNRTKKIIYTSKEGVTVDYRRPNNSHNEITDIIDRLLDNQLPEKRKTTAILARTNKQVHAANNLLTRYGVPCETVTAAESPLATAAARNVFSWISAITNKRDDAAFKKIAAAKMNKSAILATEKSQLTGDETFAEALKQTKEGQEFFEFYEKIELGFTSALDVVSGTIWLNMTLDIGIDKSLIDAISKWQQKQVVLGESVTADALLKYVKLCGVIDKPTKEFTADKVYLMTAHGSKGLEFDEVFIIGAVQNVFPSSRNFDEERRLFYVAMTRARNYLNISSPHNFANWNGDEIQAKCSQYIEEMKKSAYA
jgi:DNA helicase-2/ATP-dependent DNA helicase PcrA